MQFRAFKFPVNALKSMVYSLGFSAVVCQAPKTENHTVFVLIILLLSLVSKYQQMTLTSLTLLSIYFHNSHRGILISAGTNLALLPTASPRYEKKKKEEKKERKGKKSKS